MSLASAQIKAAILHPNREVRDAAVSYFSRSFSSDPTILPLVIEAIERFGWEHATSALGYCRNWFKLINSRQHASATARPKA